MCKALKDRDSEQDKKQDGKHSLLMNRKGYAGGVQFKYVYSNLPSLSSPTGRRLENFSIGCAVSSQETHSGSQGQSSAPGSQLNEINCLRTTLNSASHPILTLMYDASLSKYYNAYITDRHPLALTNPSFSNLFSSSSSPILIASPGKSVVILFATITLSVLVG